MKYFKTLVLAAVLLISATSLFAFPGLPNYFYGNIAIKTDGTLVTNTNIQVRITIYDGTTSLYSETFNPVAVDAFGAFIVNVGTGTLASGSWPAGPATANMRTQAEIDYGSGWVSLGARPTMQLIYQSTYGFSGNPAEINLNSGEILVGDVTNHAAPVNISGDATIDNTGALTLAITDVTAGTYGDGTHVAQVTVDGKGRLQGASNVAITFPAETDPVWTAAISGNQTISGNWTFSNLITGSISGNAATVTNGVYTTGSYADPAWITSLAWSKLAGTPTTLLGYGITDAYTKTYIDANFQPLNTNLTSIAGLANAAGWLHNDGAGAFAYSTPTKADVGLGNVENTALSTWAGTTNITTLGAITTGTWQGTAIADTYVANDLTIDGGSVTNSTVTPGTGHVTADYFVGSGSTTNAVDLATAEVAGILPDANVADDLTISTTDAKFTLQDNLDGTKLAQFELSGIATNTTRTYSLPNADGTIALTSNITLQGAYDGGNTITTAGGNNITIAGTEQVILNNANGMYINHNNAVGTYMFKVENSNAAFANPLIVSAATGSARAANFTANNATYAVNVEQDGTGNALQVSNIGGGSALYIDNGGLGGLAIDIADVTGGAVKLSYDAVSVSSDALTIPDGVSVYMITSDNNGTNDAITMPTGVNGQFLYVIYSSTTDNAVINGYTTTLSAQMTFVYAGGSWKLVSVVE